MNHFFKHKRGFTLVEMLVAITILVIGVLGPLAMASRGISDGRYAQNYLIGSYLAQEALEAVINQRNFNQALGSGTDWDNKLNACFTNGCYVDVTTANGGSQINIAPLPSPSDPIRALRLYLGDNIYHNYEICNQAVDFVECVSFLGDPAGGGYWSGFLYFRTLTIEEVVAGKELKVTSTVDWIDRGQSQSVTLVQNLFKTSN
ncbi:MAG: prepilin-type N-terminal cleavage/methylation domain-containing protein [Patescibacteria group bacterium]